MADELRTTLFEVGGDPVPWGWITLVASDRGLRYLGLPASSADLALRRVRKHYSQSRPATGDQFLTGVAEQVQRYLAGELQEFSVEVDLRGHTQFELAVWAVTARIPYAATRTYGWLAGQLGGGPGTAQAVGAALGSNPVPLVVPCHRVIGSDGSLHGFAGGLDMKARLLALESHQMVMPFQIEEK